MEMIKGQKILFAKNIIEDDIIEHLGGMPSAKTDCVCLVKRTLEKTIQLFLDNKKI